MKVIYQIKNLINNKIYIGSAVSFKKRVELHINELNKGTHHCKYLQNAWNKHKQINFKFQILEVVELIDNLILREQYYLDTLLFAQEFILNKDKRFNKFGYNICPIAGSRLHSTVSEESKKKISNSTKGIKKSSSHSRNIKIGVTAKSGKSVIDIVNDVEYSSISEASRITGLSIAAISKQCSKNKIGRNFTFRFIEDIV